MAVDIMKSKFPKTKRIKYLNVLIRRNLNNLQFWAHLINNFTRKVTDVPQQWSALKAYLINSHYGFRGDRTDHV